MTEESQKKVVGRTVAIVLGMICIILSASLVAVIALYLPAASLVSQLKSEMVVKNSTIGSQSSTITSLTQQVIALQNSLQESSKDETIAALNSYISDLLNVLYLNVSAILLQNQGVQMEANDSVTVWSDVLMYAGFVAVHVQSDSNTTYAQVVYSSYGVNYNETITVGVSGTAYFPVLPSSMVDIRLGNTESSSAVVATVVAIYRY